MVLRLKHRDWKGVGSYTAYNTRYTTCSMPCKFNDVQSALDTSRFAAVVR